MKRLGVPSTKRTRKALTEVNRATVALAVTPLFIVIPVSFFSGIAALGLQLGMPAFVGVSLAKSIITLVNPIVTIGLVRPYREGLLRRLGVRTRPAAIVEPFGLATIRGSALEMETGWTSTVQVCTSAP
ncbi:hypothetical protein AAVH_29521 [Aphelenchoides avenae]|nr:hypothetical protein AAVH_29521 [Aphelenchus avenae]